MIADKITADAQARQLTVYLPDTRGVHISRFGVGNLKIGLGVHTYSRLPGITGDAPLGSFNTIAEPFDGTCPGATKECQEICYAARPVAENGAVAQMWTMNSLTEAIPDDLPPGCRLLRLHVSGDFTTIAYIDGWRELLTRHPEVTCWAYTRSWRVPRLLPALERLRALPNVQLFASMDYSTPELPPLGWRRAWIDGDPRADRSRETPDHISDDNRVVFDGETSYVCPEETGRRANCEECRYCFRGQTHDVTFLKH